MVAPDWELSSFVIFAADLILDFQPLQSFYEESNSIFFEPAKITA